MSIPRTSVAAFVAAAATALFFASYADGDENKRFVAVLEFRNQAGLSEYEIATVTDMLRIAAREKLAEREFIVMTRENMVKLLPPGKDLSKCIEAECEVEVGRQVGADYVVAGEVGKFGSALQLYDTRTGDLMAGQIAEAVVVDGLKGPISEKAAALFAKLTARATPTRAEWTPDSGEMVIAKFSSDPEGAVLFLDGTMLCQKTPCTKAVNAGIHEVSVQMERHLPKSEKIEIKKGTDLSYKLELNIGWLTILTKPPGLAVKVDREEKGRSPVTKLELVAKAYEVAIVDPCFEDVVENVSVERGKEKRVALSPKPQEGAVSVTAEDQNGDALEAEAQVDGKFLGKVPGTYKVPVCSREIRVLRKAETHEQILGIQEKKIERVVAKFNAFPKTPKPIETMPTRETVRNELKPDERTDTIAVDEKAQTPWYKTWWFWTLAGAAAVGTGVGAYFLLSDKTPDHVNATTTW